MFLALQGLLYAFYATLLPSILALAAVILTDYIVFRLDDGSPTEESEFEKEVKDYIKKKLM